MLTTNAFGDLKLEPVLRIVASAKDGTMTTRDKKTLGRARRKWTAIRGKVEARIAVGEKITLIVRIGNDKEPWEAWVAMNGGTTDVSRKARRTRRVETGNEVEILAKLDGWQEPTTAGRYPRVTFRRGRVMECAKEDEKGGGRILVVGHDRKWRTDARRRRAGRWWFAVGAVGGLIWVL